MQKLIKLEEGWVKVAQGIDKLHRLIATFRSDGEQTIFFSNEEFELIYRTVYLMCTQKPPNNYAADMYERYERTINDYLKDVVVKNIQSNAGERMVKAFVEQWENHVIIERWLSRFFGYLDRYYVKKHYKKPLKELSVRSFRLYVFDVVKSSITQALLQMISKDRNEEKVDHDLIAQAVRVYVKMGMGSLKVYAVSIEAPFLASTRTHYTNLVSKWLDQNSTPLYLRKAEKCFDDEKKRLKGYLHESTEEALMKELCEVVLSSFVDTIVKKVDSGCKWMLENRATDDLKRMYRLVSYVPESMPSVARVVCNHITSVCMEMSKKANEEKNYSRYIEGLIAIHDNFHKLIIECFCGDTIFQKALSESFEGIMNQKVVGHTSAELLSDFANEVLKKGGLISKMNDIERDIILDSIVRMFTYLSEKDMFSEFYRKHLSKRLLLQRSESKDAENIMLGKLKLKCGAQFTSKLEGMIIDLRTAEENSKGFIDYQIKTKKNLDMDMNVQTLTAGFWPPYKPQELKLPISMENALNTFQDYYHSNTNNRKLKWIHQLGIVTIAGHFSTRRIDLTVSTLQASILLTFNDVKSISIADLTRRCGLRDDIIKSNLKALCSGSFKILLKEPAKGYALDHMIRPNIDFVSAQRRIRVPNPATRITSEERIRTQDTVLDSRKHTIDARIVRIMKIRKTLSHPELVAEVLSQLMKFHPIPKEIKRRIEDLLDRDYLKRDDNNLNIYHYVA